MYSGLLVCVFYFKSNFNPLSDHTYISWRLECRYDHHIPYSRRRSKLSSIRRRRCRVRPQEALRLLPSCGRRRRAQQAQECVDSCLSPPTGDQGLSPQDTLSNLARSTRFISMIKSECCRSSTRCRREIEPSFISFQTLCPSRVLHSSKSLCDPLRSFS